MMHISKYRCIGCNLCVLECPVGAISIVAPGAANINTDVCINCNKCIDICPQNAVMEIGESVLIIAIGTDDEERIKGNDHVGMSDRYMVYRYFEGDITFMETRKNIPYQEDETRIHGDPEKAKKVAGVLADVDVVVGSMFGPNIARLKRMFVPVVIREPMIDNAIYILKDGMNEIIEEWNKEEKRVVIL